MGNFQNFMKVVWAFRSTIIVIGAPLLLLIMLPFKQQMGLTDKAGNCLYVLLLMAVYWTTEAIDMSATALLPLVLYPTMGVMSAEAVAQQYFKDTTVLLMGGLLIAVAIESCGVQKRIALNMLRLLGTNQRMLILGFMLPTWFISMWISNTAAAAMMITIVQSVLNELKRTSKAAALDVTASTVETALDAAENGEDIGAGSSHSKSVEALAAAAENPAVSTATLISANKDVDVNADEKRMADGTNWETLGKALSICVAYSATIGGMATLTGTGTNLILMENLQSFTKNYGDHPDFGIDFASWMVVGLPLSLILLIIGWIWLQILFFGFRHCAQDAAEATCLKRIINNEYNNLGKIRFGEVVVCLNLLVLVILWLSRDPGNGVGGWAALFVKGYVKDGTAAIAIGLLLFILPSSKPRMCCLHSDVRDESNYGPVEGCLTWKKVHEKMSWGVLILCGGGFALAEGVMESGLSGIIGDLLASSLGGLPDWALVMVIATLTAALTEVASNVAIVTLFLPIVAQTAVSINKNPLYLMFPTCLAASFAFMFPVATPPNAIVFSTGVLKVSDMAKAGIFMNIVGILAITLATVTWASTYFHLDEWTPRLVTTDTSITSSDAQCGITTL